MHYVIDISEQDKGVTKKGYIERKYTNKTRRVSEEDECYLDEYSTFKRTHYQGENDEELLFTSEHIIFKRKLFHGVKRVWK